MMWPARVREELKEGSQDGDRLTRAGVETSYKGHGVTARRIAVADRSRSAACRACLGKGRFADLAKRVK